MEKEEVGGVWILVILSLFALSWKDTKKASVPLIIKWAGEKGVDVKEKESNVTDRSPGSREAASKAVACCRLDAIAMFVGAQVLDRRREDMRVFVVFFAICYYFRMTRGTIVVIPSSTAGYGPNARHACGRCRVLCLLPKASFLKLLRARYHFTLCAHLSFVHADVGLCFYLLIFWGNDASKHTKAHREGGVGG